MGHRAGRRLRDLLRDEYRSRHRQIGWRYVVGVAVYCTLCSIFICWMAWTSGASAAWFAAGAGVGLAPLFLWIVLHTDEAERLEQAAFAEEWVEEELATLVKDGWKALHNISLGRYDVDHVVVGPAGVIVIETKWSRYDLTASTRIAEQVMAKNGDQLKRNCREIDRRLKRHGSPATTRRGLLAVAGPYRPDGYTRSTSGLYVVPVHELASFVSKLSHKLDAQQIDDAHRALTAIAEGPKPNLPARV